jgi:hypothetical protein
MTSILTIFVVAALIAVTYFIVSGKCLRAAEHLVGSGTRIVRGVGLANDADETKLGGGIITSQPIFDRTYTYFDGTELVSCDECPNPVLCQGCPNMMATAELYNMEPRGRVGAGRSPIIGTSTHVRAGLSEKYSSETEEPARHLRGCKRHTPATARGLLNEKAAEPQEFVGLNNYQYIHRRPW